jgi:hypothetical protein
MAKIEVNSRKDFKKSFRFPVEYRDRLPKWQIYDDFDNAMKILSTFEDGRFFVTNNPYELFVFEIKDKVRILFYPHKVKSTHNVNIRPRNQSSKDTDLFNKIKDLLENNDIRMFWFKQNCK